MTTTYCGICYNTEWRSTYEYVPYGNTLVAMPDRHVCTQCGADYEEAVELCDECENPVDDCICEEDELYGNQPVASA